MPSSPDQPSLISADGDQPKSTPAPAPLHGRWASLRPVVQADYDYLYWLANHPEIGYRWRPRGITPSPEDFARGIWQGVICNYIVENNKTRERAGLAVAYEPNLRARFSYIAFVLAPEHQAKVWPLEALERFIDYLFRSWDFRKLYAEVYEFSLAPMASGAGKYFEIEGCFKAHEYWDGRYWDLYRLAIHREAFYARPASLIR